MQIQFWRKDLKYHSTKKSIFTISLILTLLLIISAIGIFQFQAETPVQAVSKAVLSNLEMPNGYSIKIEKINESFLLSQKIEKISLNKNNKTILSISNLSINKSLFDYLDYLLFHNPLNININMQNLDINVSEPLDDLLEALSGIKIKDNTIAIQSKLEKSDAESTNNKLNILDLLNTIIQQKNIDLSHLLSPSIMVNSYNVNIEKGNIKYFDDTTTLNTNINNLNFELAQKGILNSLNLNLIDVTFNNDNNNYITDDLFITYSDNIIELSSSKIALNFQDNVAKIDQIVLKYDLQQIGQLSSDINKITYNNKLLELTVNNLKTKLTTNFKDFSLLLTPSNTYLSNGDNYIAFEAANFGLSRVNDKLSFFYKNEGETSLLFNDNLIDIFDSDLTLNSKDNFSNVKIQSIKYNKNDLTTQADNFNMTIDCISDDTNLLTDNELDITKLNIENLQKTFTQINVEVNSDIFLSNSRNTIKSSIASIFEIQDNFQNLTATVSSDNIQFDNLNKLITADINLQGPLRFAEDNIQNIEANISYSDDIFIKAVGQIENNFSNNSIKTTVLFDDFNPNDFSSYINANIPSLMNYISDETSLMGTVSFNGNLPLSKNDIVTGDINSSVLINQAKFLDSNYDIGFNFDTKIKNKILDINQLSLSIFNLRLAFDGEYNLITKSILGSFDLENIEKNEKLVEIDFKDDALYSTGFILKTATMPNFSVVGTFKNMFKSNYKIESVVNLPSDIIDLNIDLDIKNLIFKAMSTKGLALDVVIKDDIYINLDFDNFKVIDLDNSIFNGKFDFKFRNRDIWSFNINNFDFSLAQERFNFIFNGKVNQNSINLDRIDYFNSAYTPKYTGAINYNGPKYLTLFKNKFKDHYSFNFYFGDESSQIVEGSIFNNSKISNIYFDVNDLNISRYFNTKEEVLLDARVLGTTDFDSNTNIKGKIDFNETGIISTEVSDILEKNLQINTVNNASNVSLFNRVVSFIPFINLPNTEKIITPQFKLLEEFSQISFSSNLKIQNNNLILENLDLDLGNFSFNNTLINLNVENFDLALKSNLEFIKSSVITNQKSKVDVDFYLNFQKFIETLQKQFSVADINYNSVVTIFNKLLEYRNFDYSLLNNINGHLYLENFDLFKDTIEFEKLFDNILGQEIIIPNIYLDYVTFNKELLITSEHILANVNFENKKANIEINKTLGLAGDFIIDYKDKVDIFATNLDIPISILEKILYVKIVTLYGENLTGEVLIKDLFEVPSFYGELHSKSFKLKTLYTKENEIEAPNISVILNKDKIYTNKAKVRFFDIENNETINCYASIQVSFSNMIFQNFSVEVESPNYIPVYLPLGNMNLTIDAKGKNYFSFSTDGKTSYLNGDVVVKDAVIRSGVELPPWIISRQEKNGDFKISTAENNSFYYPFLDNPILSIVLAKNQNFELKFDSLSKTYSSKGAIDILQGEIFYFQKNFYINNGTFSLKINPLTKLLEPIISLEATLRELDLNGEPLDIKLNVNNNSLEKLSPIFTSIPAKDNKEIMAILGQSFSSSNTNDTNSVASIAIAATSVFSSLGFIETGGVGTLNKTIAKSLNLDFFSLKSNIVENIILETFIEDPRYSSFSPLARYLNNTTVFMGKYLTPNSKFQIMINLLASNDENATSFLSSDLALDFEMSYEIESELAKFSFFTNPTQLSILEILDTIGFSVTKTIHFR